MNWIDFDGIPLQSYSFFLGFVSREVAEANVTAVGQIGARLSSKREVWVRLFPLLVATHLVLHSNS
jgi:hypothetical protein